MGFGKRLKGGVRRVLTRKNSPRAKINDWTYAQAQFSEVDAGGVGRAKSTGDLRLRNMAEEGSIPLGTSRLGKQKARKGSRGAKLPRHDSDDAVMEDQVSTLEDASYEVPRPRSFGDEQLNCQLQFSSSHMLTTPLTAKMTRKQNSTDEHRSSGVHEKESSCSKPVKTSSGREESNNNDIWRHKKPSAKESSSNSASTRTQKTTTSTHSSGNRTDSKLIVDRVPSDVEKTRLQCSQQAFPFHHACALKPKPEHLLELAQLHPSMARKRDHNGNLPIHRLVDDCGSAFVPVLKELIRQYPQGLDEEDDRGQLPLHRFCRSKKKMSTEVAKVLLDASPSSVTKRVDGLLPLHIVCLNARSDPKVVQLVASRAPMAVAAATTGESPGKFPLHIACKMKSKHMADVVAILMNIAPEVAAIACPNGEYPLHLASAAGNRATIHAILQKYPEAARICDAKGSLPVNVAYLRWHFSALTGGEESDNLDALMILLQVYPDALYHPCANGERILDSACKKSQDKLEMLLTAAYPMHSHPALRIEDTLPENLQSAKIHMIPAKVVRVLRRLHPSCVNMVHDGEGYVIA